MWIFLVKYSKYWKKLKHLIWSVFDMLCVCSFYIQWLFSKRMWMKAVVFATDIHMLWHLNFDMYVLAIFPPCSKGHETFLQRCINASCQPTAVKMDHSEWTQYNNSITKTHFIIEKFTAARLQETNSCFKHKRTHIWLKKTKHRTMIINNNFITDMMVKWEPSQWTMQILWGCLAPEANFWWNY